MDAAELKRQVTMEQVLRHYGSEPVAKETGGASTASGITMVTIVTLSLSAMVR